MNCVIWIHLLLCKRNKWSIINWKWTLASWRNSSGKPHWAHTHFNHPIMMQTYNTNAKLAIKMHNRCLVLGKKEAKKKRKNMQNGSSVDINDEKTIDLEWYISPAISFTQNSFLQVVFWLKKKWGHRNISWGFWWAWWPIPECIWQSVYWASGLFLLRRVCRCVNCVR